MVSRICYSFRFSYISTLELNNKNIGTQIWILREISSLEPAPNVWKPKPISRQTDRQTVMFVMFLLIIAVAYFL